MKPIFCILMAHLIFIPSYAQSPAEDVDHYLFPEFTKGFVLMKTAKKDERMMNYNTLTEEMIFVNRGIKLAISKEDMGRIDTVYLQGKKFVVLNKKFVEVLHHSTWDLYAEHKCNLQEPGKNVGYGGTSQTTPVANPSSVYLGNNAYNLSLPDGYETNPYTYYWIMKNGELHKIVNMKQLKKLYKDRKDLFKDYVKKHDVNYENNDSIVHLLEYLESA